ncbi:MAG: tetratricopeptide repeat protein [Acidobacteriota bacterium]|nr:MAG: tetratricopeptide repeat protein [Acidobacteriota bacterium]
MKFAVAPHRQLQRLPLWKPTALLLSLLLAPVPVSGMQRSGLLQEGYEAFYKGNMETAKDYLEGYLRVNPKDTEARILLARTLAGQGKNVGSLVELKKVLDEDPQNGDALFYLSSLAAALSQAEYGRLYQLSPDSDRVHQLMATSYVARGLEREAEEEYLKARDRNPKNLEALIGLAILKQGIQAWAEAQRYLLEALEVDPSHVGARVALGTVLVEQGSLEQAIRELEKAVELDPENDMAYFQLGRAQEVRGNDVAATAAFEKARELKFLRQQRAP